MGFDETVVPCHLYAHTAVKETSRNFWAACPTSAHSERAELDIMVNSSFTVWINTTLSSCHIQKA